MGKGLELGDKGWKLNRYEIDKSQPRMDDQSNTALDMVEAFT